MWHKYFFVSKIPHKEENQLPPNAKIQETDPLLSLRFGTWRFRVLFVENFVLQWAAEFLRERNSKRNNVVFLIGTIRLGTPIERVVFNDCSRFWDSKSWPQHNNYSATSPTHQILLPPILWVVTWSAATSVFSPNDKGGSGESLWTRLGFLEHTVYKERC